jgi:hypothetical protein
LVLPPKAPIQVFEKLRLRNTREHYQAVYVSNGLYRVHEQGC